jgi:tetrahydromethanopterin S-methyltransferase subunit D
MSDSFSDSFPPDSPAPAAKPADPMLLVRGLAGAVVGGLAGYLLFWALARSNLAGYMIPGAALGLGAGWAARGKSQILGVICALLAVGLTLFTAWHLLFNRFTFVEFLSNLHQLHPSRWILMGLGVVFAWWFGRGR